MDINAKLMAHLGLNTRGFEKGLKDSTRKAQNANKRQAQSFRSVARSAALVTTAVVATAAAVGTLAERGAKVESVQSAFVRTAGNSAVAMDRLKASTRGLVSQYDLMVQQNTALTLGSVKTSEEFAKLAGVAQRLGRSLGLETTFAVNSLNIGIARQSRLILDNLGIIVDVDKANRQYAASLGISTDALTDSMRAQAFANEAMRKAEEAADRLGEVQRNAGDAYGEFKVELRDTADALAQIAANSKAAEAGFTGLAGALRMLRSDPQLLALLAAGGTFGPNHPITRMFEGGLTPGKGIGERGGKRSHRQDVQSRIDADLARLGPPGGIRNRFDTLTGQRTGLDTSFGRFVPFNPGGFDPGGVSALGPNRLQAGFTKRLKIGEQARQANSELAKTQQQIMTIANTVEQVLVRGLTRAIMRFESIGKLVKDIGKSLLSSVLGGLVSFGVGALTTSILGGLGIGLPAAGLASAAKAAKAGAVSKVIAAGPAGASIVVDEAAIPEPTDYGVIASKSQVQRLVVATIKAARSNGAAI